MAFVIHIYFQTTNSLEITNIESKYLDISGEQPLPSFLADIATAGFHFIRHFTAQAYILYFLLRLNVAMPSF